MACTATTSGAVVELSHMTKDMFFKPPAHGRVANWLGPQMVARLLEFTQVERASFRESNVWTNAKDGGEVDPSVRRSWNTKVVGKLRDDIAARARTVLPDICAQLGTTQFEPRRFEIEMVAHGDGAFYTEHHDRHPQSPLSSRLVSAVYYFHRLPKSFAGGALRIYPIAGSKRSTAFVEIEPTNDTLVFFPSWFPHEVLPVHCPSRRFQDSRFAINCWIHS